MGIILVIPIQSLFSFSYLGSVESEINTLEYEEAQPNFFFDYYNLNPIEDLEYKKNDLDQNDPIAMGAKKNNKVIDMLEFKRNKLVSGNYLLKAL